MTKDEKAKEKLLSEGYKEIKTTGYQLFSQQYFVRDSEYVYLHRGTVYTVTEIKDLLRLGFFDTDFTKEKIKALAQAIISLEGSVEDLGDEMRGYDD